MKTRVLFVLLSFFMVASPIAQAFGQCGAFGDEAAMAMTAGSSCQEDVTAEMCVSDQSADTQLSTKHGCFSGNFCSPHFYAIYADAGLAEPMFVISSLLAMPAPVDRLKQSASPEIKPPITLV